mmetsp:Transcript_6848/g.17092  ORF Transcript_6848/g.17092 Transcript_6848/m.17092 type:complete len:192 (+) Transcript_6848:71-646(+)
MVARAVRAAASRSRDRSHDPRNRDRYSASEDDGSEWHDRWETYGSNRGGKGARRGPGPPRWRGPDGPEPWRHDLFDYVTSSGAAESETGGDRELRRPDLPPRGLGSGRGVRTCHSLSLGAVAVWNLDSAVTAEDLSRLFSRCGRVSEAWLERGGRGGVAFVSSGDASRAVQWYHRHPWKGGRPLNVAVRRA